jgi:TolB-like protein/tetratricopeptide (TPR) repeat protein
LKNGTAFGLALAAAVPMERLAAQCPDGSAPPCRVARPAPAPAANSVAVLYFENRSRDSADAYLAEGLTEAIITQLGDLPRLTVKSRFLVRRYRGVAAPAEPAAIGRALGATYLVTGSVQRAGARLRVTAELARASSGDRVWGQQYDRGDGDVFAVQEDIARSVATGVAGRLLPAEAAALAVRPTRSNAAYDHMLRGDVLLARRDPASVLGAIVQYEAAARLDPSLASAWAKIGLADAIRLYWGWGDGTPPPDSILVNGWAAVDRALALDSSSSDGWMARGYLLMFRHPRTWDGAEEAMRRAVALNPRNAEAWQQLGDLLGIRSAGHPAADSVRREAMIAYQRALDVEPSRPTTLKVLATIQQRPRERLVLLDSALAINPTDESILVFRARALLALGDTAGARSSADESFRLAVGGARPAGAAFRAMLAVALGDTADARIRVAALVSDLPRAGPLEMWAGTGLATALWQLGDREGARAVLERMPRGAMTWALNLATLRQLDLTDPAQRRLYEENRPPWAQ